jgi:hypothetical protein
MVSDMVQPPPPISKGEPMKRTALAAALLALAGCSTAPLADFLDFVAPGRLPPEKGQLYGGVCQPQGGTPGAPGVPLDLPPPVPIGPGLPAPAPVIPGPIAPGPGVVQPPAFPSGPGGGPALPPPQPIPGTGVAPVPPPTLPGTPLPAPAPPGTTPLPGPGGLRFSSSVE